jgi:hypothetical protein
MTFRGQSCLGAGLPFVVTAAIVPFERCFPNFVYDESIPYLIRTFLDLHRWGILFYVPFFLIFLVLSLVLSDKNQKRLVLFSPPLLAAGFVGGFLLKDLVFGWKGFDRDGMFQTMWIVASVSGIGYVYVGTFLGLRGVKNVMTRSNKHAA